MAEYMIVKNNIVEAIFCGTVEKGSIELPASHQVRVGEPLTFYNSDYTRKSEVQLIQEKLVELPQGYKIDNDKLVEMTYDERIVAGLEQLPYDMKIEDGKLLPKSENELFNEMTLEEKEKFIRNKRDILINNVIWKVERHKQEKELNINTSLTDKEYLSLLKYIQALRDITNQKGFPEKVTFPTL